ncbi:MAG: iron-sulfur cluster assembly accessory protein [Candidatus Sumerlaeia bacterium]
MSIVLTQPAAEEIRRIQKIDNKEGWLLRLGVQGGGCAGLTYALNFVEQPGEDDQVFEVEGVRIAVDPRSYLYLNGLTLDFSRDLLGGGFKFLNPNATGGCRCGTSFKV